MVQLRQNPKKNFPGGFFVLFFIALLVILGVQSLGSDREAKVSFSHQVEHLTNLDLVQPEANRKIAQNDNLVTFSGKFRDQTTESGADRYRYLELLNQQHKLQGDEAEIKAELDSLQNNVQEAADLYLRVSGQPIPRNGYVVVGPLYDTPGRESSIVIRSVSDRGVVSLPRAQETLKAAEKSMAVDASDEANKEIRSLIAILRSPALGIGNESLKMELKGLDQKLELAANYSIQQQLEVSRSVLDQVSSLMFNLGKEQDGVRLTNLRSVRSYLEELQKYGEISADLEKNGAVLDKARSKVADVIWYFNNQELSTRALEKQDPESYGHWFAQAQKEWNSFSANKGLAYRAPDQPRNMVLEKTFQSQEPPINYFSYFLTLLPVFLVVLFLYFIFSRQMKGMGSSAMNFGKSPAKLMTKEQNKITFKDVAGADEAKEELKEIVDFLKDPQKFTALGARIPKGVLLVGPPGTGKTLIAKAVAGEADRPFFSISGSDFVEMFVGVGASRIRDMFDQAKKNAPCIIFMDEIDAVGRHRGAGIGGGHDEREQTLNQLLVEMDGFDTKEGVILMAATNRPDVLDRALLRPGRFDRRVVLDLPDIKGRLEILKVHARKIKIDASVDLNEIARSTPGASGADLENILNEAALLAARNNRSAVTSLEAKEACDKVRYGKERRSLEMNEEEKKTTAFHEAGHAITGLVVKNGDPVDKVTIIPRGFSLGATHFLPLRNKLSYWRKQMLDQLVIAMGGRAAEEIFVGDISSGAQQDIIQATRIARSMVCEWGMTSELGLVALDERSDTGQYLGMQGYREKSYSDETAKLIDLEVKKLTDDAYKRSIQILQDNREKTELMAEMLIEFETLDATDVKEIMDGTWDAEKKRGRLKTAEGLQKASPPPVPGKAVVPPPVPTQKPEAEMG